MAAWLGTMFISSVTSGCIALRRGACPMPAGTRGVMISRSENHVGILGQLSRSRRATGGDRIDIEASGRGGVNPRVAARETRPPRHRWPQARLPVRSSSGRSWQSPRGNQAQKSRGSNRVASRAKGEGLEAAVGVEPLQEAAAAASSVDEAGAAEEDLAVRLDDRRDDALISHTPGMTVRPPAPKVGSGLPSAASRSTMIRGLGASGSTTVARTARPSPPVASIATGWSDRSITYPAPLPKLGSSTPPGPPLAGAAAIVPVGGERVAGPRPKECPADAADAGKSVSERIPLQVGPRAD